VTNQLDNNHIQMSMEKLFQDGSSPFNALAKSMLNGMSPFLQAGDLGLMAGDGARRGAGGGGGGGGGGG
jgi:hypothetical protein